MGATLAWMICCFCGKRFQGYHVQVCDLCMNQRKPKENWTAFIKRMNAKERRGNGMNLSKLFRHDGEPCGLGIRRSAWLNMLVSVLLALLFSVGWFYVIKGLKDYEASKIEPLEQRVKILEARCLDEVERKEGK
jgi:hypothetical protein